MAEQKPSRTPDRGEQRLQERRQRQAELKKAQDSARRRTLILRSSAGAAVVLIIAGVAIWIVTHQPPAVGRNVGGGPAAQHVPDGSPINYPSSPPTSGPHYPAPASWSTYDAPLEEGRFVHNLEHGGIAILYKCPRDPDGCSTLKQQLNDLYKRLPPDRQFHEIKAVLSPYDKMPHQIDVLAWGWIDELDQFDADEIIRFYEAHVDHGPEAIP